MSEDTPQAPPAAARSGRVRRPKAALPVVAAETVDMAAAAIIARARGRQVVRGRPYIQSYGGGLDSIYILGRYLAEPDSRPFALDDWVAIMSQTGDEAVVTSEYHQGVVLPLIRAHRNPRFLQISRTGARGGSWRVLDDSREPRELLTDGDFTLRDEMLAAGTIPTTVGDRRCSLKAKGQILDRAIRDVLRPEGDFHHAFGFDSTELPRIARCEAAIAERNLKRNGAWSSGMVASASDPWWLDAALAEVGELGDYPMLRWGTDRAAADVWVRERFGRPAPRSSCRYCPYARPWSDPDVFERWRREPPERLAMDLLMEHQALAWNNRMALYFTKGSMREWVAAAGLDIVLSEFGQLLGRTEHALWHVRRIYEASPNRKGGDTSRGKRSTRRLAVGTRREMDRILLDTVAPGCRLVEQHGFTYAYVRERVADARLASEEFYVVAPAGCDEKSNSPGFEQQWFDLHPDSVPARGVQASLFA